MVSQRPGELSADHVRAERIHAFASESYTLSTHPHTALSLRVTGVEFEYDIRAYSATLLAIRDHAEPAAANGT